MGSEYRVETNTAYSNFYSGPKYSQIFQVAALAGIPRNVLKQARFQLSKLERGGDDTPQKGLLTTYQEPEPELETESPVLDKLEAIDPDEMTPRAALDLIYRLKALLRD